PTGIEPVDYEAEKERNTLYYEGLRQLPPEARRPGASPDQYPELATVLALKPRPDWNILAQVNQMSAISAYNGMVAAWAEGRACFVDYLKLILQMCATSPNDTEGAVAEWKKLAKAKNLSGEVEAAATQVFNPATGKGANRSKANALTIGGQSNFWLLEYLKLVGMRYAGLPRVVSGVKDRKTYVLLPINIRLRTSNRVFRDFSEALWASSAVKMDILAAFRYVQVFLQQWQTGQLDPRQVRRGGQPGDYVSGLAVAFYKDMGSAFAVLNQSTINLPRWVDNIETKQAAQQFLAMLTEHEAIIRPLDEKIGREYELLFTYRDFLSDRDLRHFFEFTAGYSSHLTNKIENREPIKQFTTTYLEVLMMSQDKKLKPILESAGFQNVANAIRQSTVNPQRAKVAGNRLYDIRYGLGNDLKRKANYNEEFVQALTDFMHSYNQENIQIEENYKGNPPFRRKRLTTEDIAEVIELIDTYGAKTVGNMLVAFGYARVPRESDEAVSE
ncbi:MAG: hypothetical protein HYR94_21805, partial [Chloroflexi bacterium]|nr:hypothetical protein [Chloroflexota bacterium]